MVFMGFVTPGFGVFPSSAGVGGDGVVVGEPLLFSFWRCGVSCCLLILGQRLALAVPCQNHPEIWVLRLRGVVVLWRGRSSLCPGVGVALRFHRDAGRGWGGGLVFGVCRHWCE